MVLQTNANSEQHTQDSELEEESVDGYKIVRQLSSDVTK